MLSDFLFDNFRGFNEEMEGTDVSLFHVLGLLAYKPAVGCHRYVYVSTFSYVSAIYGLKTIRRTMDTFMYCKCFNPWYVRCSGS